METTENVNTGIIRGIFLIFLICGISGCNNIFNTDQKSPVQGTRAHHGSQFEIFISELKALPEIKRDSAVKQYFMVFPETPHMESDSIVSLYWYGKARHVLINGDLQFAWSAADSMESISCEANTFFYKTYTIPSDARLDYQFVIDSVYTTDPLNPKITPSGYGPHSEIAMPRFKSDSVKLFRQNIPHGSIDSLVFSSQDSTIRPRQLKVYLPAGYENLVKLPVLYVLDGLESLQYMFYKNVLDNLIADGKIVPLMVIFLPPVERHVEYLNVKHQAFMNALCNELVPLIDRLYKTYPLPGKRGIAGISSGGHMALLTTLKHPDVFQCGAGQSPTITPQMIKALNTVTKNEADARSLRLYLDVGQYDLINGPWNNWSFLKASENFHLELEKNGINDRFNIYNDGHEWASWRERTDDILIYFFGIPSNSHRL